MGLYSGFRGPGRVRLPESVGERFWAAVRSGPSPTAAATAVGVSGATGRMWGSASSGSATPVTPMYFTPSGSSTDEVSTPNSIGE